MTPSEFRSICVSRYGYGWQTFLAAQIGVNARTVRKWASGERSIPFEVAANLQARPAIAVDYPDEWIVGDSRSAQLEDREYIIHLHAPRFIGLVADDEALGSGTTFALRDETIVDITWIDPQPSDLAPILSSLQRFMDDESG